MNTEDKIKAFQLWGEFMGQTKERNYTPDLKGINAYFYEDYKQVIGEAELHNPWFTEKNIHYALQVWSHSLQSEALQEWADHYAPLERETPKKVAVIMAGNIPLVGMHDFISVLLSGNKVLVKPSSDDDKLLPFLAQILVALERRFASYIEFADGSISNFDAVIATGSNNSARYFEQYFGKYPHIIRQNRSSVAVLEHDTSREQLELLAEDVFRYFGLGCRSVSKLLLPKGYDTDQIFEAFYKFKYLADHQKYGHNLDYYRAIYLMEKIPFLENGFVMLKEDAGLHAPTGVLYYEYYNDEEHLQAKLKAWESQLQCVVGAYTGAGDRVPFGESQKPALHTYADNVDTMQFLTQL